MAWRKWLVRTLVFSVLGLAIFAVLLYEAWTNPSAVRRQVLAKLARDFIGATVSLDSARLRLLGGIVVSDLRMARRDDLGRGDFLYVPSAVIYHDKEHLLDGTLDVRKIELDRPRLRIVRERDGRINLGGVLAPPDLKQRVPTVIIRRGTILLEDRSASAPSVVLEIKEVNLTIQNDPLSTLVLEGSGQTDAIGAVRIQARFHRPSAAASAVVDLPEVPVGPPLVQRLANFCPDGVRHVRELSGNARIQAVLAYRPAAVEPWSYDVHAELNDGQWRHDCLPVPLQQLHASLRCINGRIPHAELHGRADGASVKMDLWNLSWPGHPPRSLEEAASKIDAHIEHFILTPKTFDRLPPTCQHIRDLYQPTGPVTLTYQFDRTDAQHWEKHWLIQPENLSAQFKEFPYPLEGVTGNIRANFSSDGDDHISVDLAGRGSDRPVVVRGSIHGDKQSAVDLVVAADDVPVDHKLLAALPKKSQDLARTFLPSRSRDLGLAEQPLGLVQPAGLANIKVFIRRARGDDHFANRYIIALHDTALKYDLFPYPLEKVTGVLDIQPDHWECRDFHGSHKGGEISVNACSFRVDAGEVRAIQPARAEAPSIDGIPPESRRPQSECVQVAIHGKDILLDPEFEQALAPPEVPGRAALRNAWSMLALRGRLSFESVVVDRPDQPQDIDVAVDIKGCSMQPEFFRYAMTDLSAAVRYAHGYVEIKHVSAKHDACRLGLKKAIILLKPSGGFTAWITGIRGDDLVPDEEFLRALHPALRRGLEPLQIRNPIKVETTLTLDAPAVPGEPMKIWWDGGAYLHKQIFQAGVEIKDVDGVIWCRGHHNGRQFEGVSGHAVLERASILDQPFTQLQGRIEIAPETPDILSLYDLKANLFGGFIGGEARFTFSSPIRYEVKLDALHIQLEQFGKHNQLGADAQLQGPARAALHLAGEGTDLSGLKGNGRFEVAHGKMYRLPLLLDLLKAFGLRMPDRTAFEQARMIFGIEGPQMRIHALDLFGNAISLRGQGTLNLDGSNLHLDFSADWGRMPQLLPPGISDLSQAVSDQLFKIKLRGKITSPRFDKELMPGVVDPIKKVFGGS
jgi:hypothetical protein